MKHSTSQIRSVCVYCGSSPGQNPKFMQSAQTLGRALANASLGLVYGGGDNGLMGAVAKSAMDAGGSVTGIIPEFLMKLEQPDLGENLNAVEMITVPDMHARKQMMFERADAFAALPGGIGTLEELVEVSTWAQLGRHTKPIILLNIDNFWSPYQEMVEHMAGAGFLHNPEQAKPVMLDDAADVVPALLGVTS